jgi:hypothetical protein
MWGGEKKTALLAVTEKAVTFLEVRNFARSPIGTEKKTFFCPYVRSKALKCVRTYVSPISVSKIRKNGLYGN